ncbi:hypothetical protein ABNB59_14145 [Paenibacillus larvae]|uniref:ABC-2 family transporter protein n=1 Tax=Paenibacillus larvae TaxID=1464 RepID=A0AAP5N5D8_9BACL|nr:hypothetical protein [Paenibacillus larvae]AQR76856.1 hypothetical protein BXP28_05200 [Paenibacillus larvae subsp. larvae]AVF22239.1 hypothetical protein ERICI_02399 [Paenibacillus larvae subsp. larvae]ETK26915.1 hypothetical protein ERIC1_1c03510 [Paenibacillus larvae subsp. larvae DSM 25719]MCY7477405.1 hypothetical protein [Paenibacillus larvae]MCY7491488.1 hypothetical protein [Paenibacillus larvae]
MRKFLILLKRDFLFGLEENKGKLLVIFILMIIMIKVNSSSLSPSNIGDIVLGLLEGYDKTKDEVFHIPASWICFHLSAVYIVSHYTADDLHDHGPYILTRTNNKSTWWLSKSVWIVMNVTLYYLLFVMIVLVWGFVTRTLSYSWSENSLQRLPQSVTDASLAIVLMKTIIISFFFTLMCCLLQQTLSMLIKPIYGFITVAALVAISSFVDQIGSPGNYGMIARTELFRNEEGTMLSQCFMVNGTIAAVSFIAGLLYILKKDVLSAQD